MPPVEPKSKRQKLSPAEDLLNTSSALSTSTKPAGQTSDRDITPASSPPNPRSSWYNRTWPRKALPITEVARESISSASSSAAETASIFRDKVRNTPTRKSSLALTLGKTTSNKSLPADAATTKDHATSKSKKSQKEQIDESTEPDLGTKPKDEEIISAPTSDRKETQISKGQQQTTTTLVQPERDASKDTVLPQPNAAPRSWIGWLARGDGIDSTEVVSSEQADEASKKDLVAEDTLKPQPEVTQTQNPESSTAPAKPVDEVEKQPSAALRRSWIPSWSTTAASQSEPALVTPAKSTHADLPEQIADTKLSLPSHIRQESEVTKDSSSTKSDIVPKPSHVADKSTGWGFWPLGKPTDTRSLDEVSRDDAPLAATSETEDKPRRASADLKNTVLDDASASKTATKPLDSTKASSLKDGKDIKKTTVMEAKGDTKAVKIEGSNATATAIPVEPQVARPATPTQPKKTYEHLLLPAFQETLTLPENLTWMQQLARLFYGNKETPFTHLNLSKDRPRIKKALAIGVHGYFPAPLIRSVLGQPTGTSVKFAEMAAKSITRWTKKEGYECQVKSAALEGEGKIAERIDLLWKLLLNWIEDIRKSDLVLIACHSQGVPVATMLVAKLIHFGCLASTTRVAICAMAGVNMGPFPEFKSRWISGSAGELFEFSDSNSKVSTDYLAALDDVLKFGARITYVGSIDDQLVSLESSLFAPISHPHIYRAVSTDSRIHAPSFLSHLVGFALKLRNLGVQDHGLIRELSGPLAGSLYSGEGHSRLYEDGAIYDLAVSFALETTSMPGVPLTQRHISSSTGNPFILPFAMRGMLEEDFVKSDLQGEAEQLLKEFDEWKPTTKALKDVKWRLEGIRSRL